MHSPISPSRRVRLTRRRAGLVIAVLLLAGGGTAAVVSQRGKADHAKPAAPALRFGPGEVAQPVLAPMPQRIDFSGPLVAPNTAVVKAKAAGTLLALAVAEGQRVTAGQPLGRIDMSDLQTRIDDRTASVESAQAALLEAERNHEANVGLAEQKFISGTALRSSQARLDAARAALRSAKAQLATTHVTEREAALVAPIGGIVGKRHVVPGEKLSAEQPVFTIVDLKTLELAGTVSTAEVSLLRPGQPVQVAVEGTSEPVAGRIDRIAPMAEAGTRAIGVVVKLANADERFRAGQYAQAVLQIGDATPRLTVPLAAITQSSGQDQVWTIEKGALVRRIVITGRKDVAGGRAEVLKGLTPESQVLSVRFDNLKEGTLAQVGGGTDVPGLPSGAAASASSPGGPPKS